MDLRQLDKLEDTKKAARYLYSNVPVREAVQLNKRVTYFRGKKLIDFLLNGDKNKDKPICVDENDAIKVGRALLEFGLIHGSVVKDKRKRELEPVRNKGFSADGYYTWLYEGSQFKRNLMLGAFIFAFLSITMFPVWPQWSKVGVWYISVTLLIFITVFIFVRLIIFIVLWMLGFECWILPNVFMDDLGFWDSFKPLYTFQQDPDLMDRDQLMMRMGVIFCFIGSVYWLANQPTEFDEIMVVQKQFLQDLYDGNLLSDESQTAKDNIDKVVPDLEELERMVQEDEMEIEEQMKRMMQEDENEEAENEKMDKADEDEGPSETETETETETEREPEATETEEGEAGDSDSKEE